MKFIWIVGLHLVLVGFACSVGTKRRIPVVNSYDPGPCEKKTHGKEVLVKNRADEENIVICVKDRGVYQWKSADGSQNTVGEFFNPGYDCSDILNKRRDAKDGFYWMTLKFSKPKKAWCDMITDGGGYILIGRKNNSITWSVPSNDIPVEPYGDPHWLSSLGDAQILDFRIQMATKEDFKYTVAHWSFRLQSTRPLKKLLITTDGCDQRSAGIGNIAYVKDLQTERVVTTTLRCSKFGFAHHSSSPFGWPKMNACLKKPCPWGFAYLVAGKYKHLLDYYGAFSYSTTGRISGMEYNATAFVGCDNQVCCACYGPLGGKKDYCTENCKAVNGGTVTKDIFSLFWIRSSLPKRLWKKCMEYELKRRDGKVIWYKLVGESIVPVEGRCSKDTALLHDGIVVVPNYTAAQKVPAIDGLLEYRKDKQELYVRSNKTWNAVAQKNKILKEIREENMVNLGEVRKLEKGLDSQKQLMNLTFIQLDKEIRNLRKYASAHLLHKECNSYKVIENKDRNIKYGGGGSPLCDSKISPGWYRFRGDAGTQMSTTCVKGSSSSSNLKYSTHAVSWLNGAHPSVSEGKVTRKVCFSYGGNCCYYKKTTIEVINCGFFYVYKLSRPPGCHYRYCGTDM